MAVKLLISDFDGTLVDTFEANYLAYRQAFRSAASILRKNVTANVSVFALTAL